MISIKIVTVNIPIRDINTIEKMIGEDSLFPSRSELIRVATREFIQRRLTELEGSKDSKKLTIKDNEVKVLQDGNNYKTYKILRRLV